MKKKFSVEVVIPEGASVAEMKSYIEDAVTSWAGSLRPAGGFGQHDPGDPLFYLDRSKVKVTRQRNTK